MASPAARLRLTTLEDVIAPTVSLGPISVVGGPAVEGGTITLNGTTTVLSAVGSARLVIDWGDGSNKQVVSVAEGVDVPFSINHVLLDDNPSKTASDQVAIDVRLEDTGPRKITEDVDANDFGYRAYDVPGLNIDLGKAFAADPAKSGIVVRLNGSNDGFAAVPFEGQFTFYGQTFTGVNVSDNGLLSFHGANASGANTSLSAGGKLALIAPFWDDLRTDTSLIDRVLTRTVDLDGESGNDYFIIEWSRVPHVGNDASQIVTFQALLQLNTGAVNGDIIFNYVDTTFADGSPLNFGASATIGIQSGGPVSQQVQKGAISLSTASNRDLFKDNQAVRFSVRDVDVVRRVGPDGFGYNAYPMPFESQIDLETAPVPPATTNGNLQLLGIAGAFDNVPANAAVVLNDVDTLNFYGTLYNKLSLINVTDNGLMLFNGSDTSPLNGNLTSKPGAQSLAVLWDDWVGAAGVSAVFARVIDFDGDNQGEFLCVEWSAMENKGAANDPATWQALIELNTGPDDAADIYLNYRDTFVGDSFFDNGGRATVGIKDFGSQSGSGARRLLLGQDDDDFDSATAFGIFQTTTPARNVIVQVDNVEPQITQQADVTINEGERVLRTINFVDPSGTGFGEGDSFSFRVDYGDGTDTLFGTIDPGGRSFIFDHYFADNGDYTIRLDVSDDDIGAAPQITFTVRVLNVRPAVTITAQPILIRPQQLAGFLTGDGLAFVSDPGFTYAPAGTRETLSYLIEWGDGESTLLFSEQAGQPGGPDLATTLRIFGEHLYTKGGPKTITVKVADDDMQSADPTDFVTATLTIEVGSKNLTVFGADAGGGPAVVAYNTKVTSAPPAFSFFAYAPGFRGGVRVASGDVDGDGLADIITAAGATGGPHIRVFSGDTGNELFGFFAYDARFSGGVYVASGDVDGDGFADIITGAGQGGGPHVRVFSGRTRGVISEFFAYNPLFAGGVRVAAADLDGDGRADIVTGAGPGGGPHVRAFSGADGRVLNSFFAYAPTFTGGVSVTAGDFDGSGPVGPVIVTGPGIGGGPTARVWSGLSNFLLTQFDAFPPGNPGSGPPFTGDQLWLSGLNVAATDLGGDGIFDLVAAPGPGRLPNVRFFFGNTALSGTLPTQQRELRVFDLTFLGGMYVGGN